MMKFRLIAPAIGLGLFCTTAQAQYAARSVTPKVPGVTTVVGSGSYQGADNCASAHTVLPSGHSTGNPFTTGTTGTTGQNEANCYFFGLFGVTNDVWFRWTDNTATTPQNVTISTCNGTGVDTKIAVWPDQGPSGCPADGTSIACNDDACGLQTSVSFTINPGASAFTIQLGTFPGAAGGSGTFDITKSDVPACGQRDDGTTENALGLIAGGELGWLKRFDCLDKFSFVETAYGTAMFPGSVTNGANSKICVFTDPTNNGDPNTLTAGNVVASVLVVVANGDTDIFNQIPVGHLQRPAGEHTWLLASADHVAGQFPAPMDQTTPAQTAETWVVGSTLGPGTLDCNNLANNNVPPTNMAAIGFPCNWLLRGTDDTDDTRIVAVCFGDGSGAPCGCGNESPAGGGAGCLNSLALGGRLAATGNNEITNDTIQLTASNVRNQPGLFFQANNTIAGGAGATFGDGIRCCGQNVIRLQIITPPAPQPSTGNSTVTITNTGPPGTVLPGDKKCYQYWYRDPGPLNPCGSNFNFTNAISIIWKP